MENVDAQIRAGSDARRVVGRDCDPHHAAARVRRRAGRDASVLLQETRGAELGGPAEALREEPVGIPPHRHESGGPANVEKLGFPTVFVLSWRDLPPPLRSRFGISPLPSKNWQLKN